MARQSDRERVTADQKRINAATKVAEEWADRWSVEMLEKYYYGEQWQGDSQMWDSRKYVINLFYPSINISKPSLLFQIPKYKVTPRNTRIDDPASDAEARAKLQEDTLNTFVQDPKLAYSLETGLALLDGQFRFGIMEVGYTSDWTDNPTAGAPVLSDEVDEMGRQKEMLDREGKTIAQAKVIVNSEELFLKWIPACNFRISEQNGNRFADCDWVGYFEWHHLEDVKANPNFKNTSSLKATGRAKAGKLDAAQRKDEEAHAGMVKVWKVWDRRAKMKRVFAEGAEKYLYEGSFSFLPFAALKFDEILGQWLPLPVSYNWVHPQNQLNDIREMRRLHRKRAVRRYLRRNGAFANEEEFAKLCEGDDMSAVEVAGDPTTAIVPMLDAPLDPAIFRDEATTLEDFTRVTGISGEAQQVAQSETATQANLIALMGQTRENARRMVVGKWLGELGRIILLTLREKMALPMWVKRSVDPASELAMLEAQEVAGLWQQIVNEDLGDIDLDISVDIASMSPVQQAQERQDLLTFLQLLVTPPISMILAVSPYLLQKFAGLFNIHNERDLVELSKAVGIVAVAAASGGAAGGGTPGQGGQAGPGPTPSNDAIAGQLQNQLPVEQGQQ